MTSSFKCFVVSKPIAMKNYKSNFSNKSIILKVDGMYIFTYDEWNIYEFHMTG